MTFSFSIKIIRLTAFAFIITAGILSMLADTANAVNNINTTCTGSHCEIAATWMAFKDEDRPPLAWPDVNQFTSTQMNLDTVLETAKITNQNGQFAPFAPGDTLTVPINAEGEMISTGAQFYDSPPVNYLPGGVVQGIMKNLVSCTSIKKDVLAASLQLCIPRAENDDVIGSWSDTWTSTNNGVTCTSNAAGTQATCTTKPTLNANLPVTVTLSRTVSDFSWRTRDSYLGKTGVPTANLHPFNLVYYPELYIGWGTQKPGTMKTSAVLSFRDKDDPPPDAITVDVKASSSATGPFTDGPITISRNTSAYLQWTSDNADTCTATGPGGTSDVPTSAVSYKTGALTQTAIFTITCDALGVASASDSVTVNVQDPPPAPECSDTIDNDGDNLIDCADPGCWIDPNNSATCDPNDDDERNDGPRPVPECRDRVDNDGDNLIDCADPGCWIDPNNSATCDPNDDDERNTSTTITPTPPPGPECNDAIDNDGDNLIDCADPGCWIDPNNSATCDPNDDDERNDDPSDEAECSDGIDNDADGLIDEDDPGCHTDNDPGNPASFDPEDNDESHIPSLVPGGFKEIE